MRSITRGAMTILATLVTLLSAVPAVADAPAQYEITRILEGETDPCTGDSMDVHFTWHVREHVHNNNMVFRFDGVAVDTNGGVANGTESQVINKKWLNDTFNWVSSNETTGFRHTVKGRIKIDLETGEFVKFDVDSFRCLGSG